MSEHHDKTEQLTPVSSALETRAVGSAVLVYLAHIFEALWTILVGLRITSGTFLYSLVHRPVTVLYPEVNLLDPWQENDPEPLSHQVSERYRGFLTNDIEQCTSCGACRTACPVDAIEVVGLKFPDVKGMVLKQYDINYALCIYCGLCVEACPPNCLTFQRDFELPVDDLKLLYRVFVTEADHQRLLEKAPRKAAKPEKPAPAEVKKKVETSDEAKPAVAKKSDAGSSGSTDVSSAAEQKPAATKPAGHDTDEARTTEEQSS